MFLFSCLCIHTIFHIYAHFIHTYIYIHTFVGDRIFHFAAYCRDCNNVTAHGLQLLCKCSRIIGGSMTVLEIRFINYLMFVVLFLTKNQEHLIPNMISIFKRFRIKITIFHFPKFLKPFVFYLQKRENLKMMLLFDV